MQTISVFLLVACPCSSPGPCADLVVSLKGSQWLPLLARLLHFPKGTWAGVYKTIVVAKFFEC